LRYIGNKTRLLGFIRRVIRARGIEAGTAVDPFSGTASVARALKRWNFSVAASDIMEYGYVLASAYVEAVQPPRFERLRGEAGGAELRHVLRHLNTVPAEPGFMHEHYSPAGDDGARHGRMYFTPENAARIDAVRRRIHEWDAAGLLDGTARNTLLAALIEAADRVANTTGVYAAFVKAWQPNAQRPLMLRALPHIPGNSCHAYRRDAVAAVADAGTADLLYLDPPYNARQYAGYYHIPELIARGWFDGPVRLRGKTGLIDDAHLRTDWSSSRRCVAAFEHLMQATSCRHVIMSYNAEGIIAESDIERVLRDWGRHGSYRRYRQGYRRYRSDADGENRHYRGDRVAEYLYCASR
jgi:adenine-specific DNA-methyltransferase